MFAVVQFRMKSKYKSQVSHIYPKVESFDPNDSYVYVLDDCLFEAMSKRAWTDVLLQIYKVRSASLCICLRQGSNIM